MSFTAPVEDHPDFTRQSQWTTAPVVNVTAGATTTPTVLGPFYVGGFESSLIVAKNLQAATGFVFRFRWWADEAATISTGEITYETFGTQPIRDQTPNRGPVLTVEVTSNFVAARTFSLLVLPRTGTPPGGGMFGDGIVNSNSGVIIAGGGGQLVQAPTGVCTGPASIGMAATTGAWSIQVECLDSLGSLFVIPGAMAGNGEAAKTAIFNLPPYYPQVRVTNLDPANQTFRWSVGVQL